MRTKLRNKFNILVINFIFFGTILSAIEIFLGKYFSFSPPYKVPEAQIDMKKIYDTRKSEYPRNIPYSIYSRDKNGYRPYNKDLSKNGIVLTVGGSTTDQRFVDDARTWQRFLEKEISLSVINGGVDGQSTFGHIVAINKWHSISLNNKNIKSVIFYVGVNDVRFSKSLDAAIGNIYDSPTKIRRLRTFFARRSFLYSRLRDAKIKFNYLIGRPSITPNGAFQIGHRVKNPNFLNQPYKALTIMSNNDEIRPYEEIFSKLLLETSDKFRNATINIVQQQAPICAIKRIEDGFIYLRVAKNEIKNIDEYCVALASIYKAQEKVIKELGKENINLIKMYIDNPVPDNGFYDGLHTNSKGSLSIAKYLKTKLKI